MGSLIQAAAGPDDLVRIADPRQPFRFDRIFAGEGLGHRRLARQRLKLLKTLEDDLARMLEAGESVELVSWGIEYAFLEACFLGIWHYVLNRRALVFTDRRMLLLQIDGRRRLRELKFAVPYAAIRGFVKGGLGYFGLVLADGTKLVVTGIPGPDRKAIRALVQARLGRASGAGRQNLCPHCDQPVQGLPERCPRCHGAFKSGARAGWLSLLMPGLGDLYLGHTMLGAIQLAGALVGWSLVIAPLLLQPTPDVETAATVAGALVGGLHAPDAWITRRTGRKGLYPAR